MAYVLKPPCDEGVIQAGAGAAPCGRSAEPWVLAATILGSSMAFIDASVVNVALPVIQSELNATVVDTQWIVESYALFLAALLLVGGSLGDHYGRRRVFTIGVVLFTIASVLCGLAQDANQLIVARGLQGVGGALLVPGSLAIISASFEEERRGRAIGAWSGFTAVTATLGPLIGGWLIDNLSWRWIFLINVPIAIAVISITLRHVPESRDEEAARLDWPGALLVTVGLGAFVFGLVESSSLGFGHPLVLAALALGVAALMAFIVVEARGREPMMPLTLFRSRTFSGVNLLTVLLYGALGGALFFLPFNLVQVQGYSATAAGAAFLPAILLMFVLSRWAGGLVTRYGSKLPLTVGPVVVAVGLMLFTLPGTSGSYWTTFFPAVVVLGLGMAISVAPLTTTVMNAVEARHSGLASGVNNAASRTGGLLAVAILGIVVFAIFNASLDNRIESLDISPAARQELEEQRINLAATQVPAGVGDDVGVEIERAIRESFVFSFRIVMLVGAGMALAGALSTALIIEGRGLVITLLDLKSGKPVSKESSPQTTS